MTTSGPPAGEAAATPASSRKRRSSRVSGQANLPEVQRPRSARHRRARAPRRPRTPPQSSARRSSWSRRRSTPAAAARAAASSSRKTPPRRRTRAAQASSACTLVTPQTGPEGSIVRSAARRGGPRHRQGDVPGRRRSTARTRASPFMASTEGGVEIEEVAASDAREDPPRGGRPGRRLPAVPGAARWPIGLGLTGDTVAQVRRSSAARSTRAFVETDASLAEINPLVVAEGRRRRRARRQDRTSTTTPCFRHPDRGRAARPRRGGPAEVEAKEHDLALHHARRQHRLHGQRRRPGHGHHGHHQARRRRAGQLPRRGRRRHRRSR